jgi:hypothetical protein
MENGKGQLILILVFVAVEASLINYTSMLVSAFLQRRRLRRGSKVRSSSIFEIPRREDVFKIALKPVSVRSATGHTPNLFANSLKIWLLADIMCNLNISHKLSNRPTDKSVIGIVDSITFNLNMRWGSTYW